MGHSTSYGSFVEYERDKIYSKPEEGSAERFKARLR